MKRITILLSTAFLFVMACSKESSDTNTTSSSIPDIYKKIYGATDMYVEGNYVVIKTKDLPDHKSPYYKSTQWEGTKYEPYNGSNSSYFSNNVSIQQQNLTFKIPLNATAKSPRTSRRYGRVSAHIAAKASTDG